MKIRRRMNVLDSYKLDSLYLEYLKKVAENDNPNVEYAIEKKHHGGGKWYLYRYDLVEIPDIPSEDLIPLLEPPHGGYFPYGSPEAEENRKRMEENGRRVRAHLDKCRHTFKRKFGT